MKYILKDIYDEIKYFIEGKTTDALIPPLAFVITNQAFDLIIAIGTAIGLSILIAIYRKIKGNTLLYVLTGILGVIIASSFAYLADNASNYFLPGLILSGVLNIVLLISIIIRRPLAAFLSHLSRGWPLSWYFRKDVRPAYTEVSIFWLILLIIRFSILTNLFVNDNAVRFFWIKTLLGFPTTITVLALSYIYGIWRLKNLSGPSVDEYLNHQEPPYESQNKGF